jgi:S1-C subfamily serine protease
VSQINISVGVAILVGVLAPGSMAQADALHACLSANGAFEKIDTCSVVIRGSRQREKLERAFLRRGNAYVEVGRFGDAVNDFSALIRINPRVAGYYDNRQNALRSMGLFQAALGDANTAIRLAPTYSFGYRSRGNVNDAMGRFDSAIADYTKGVSIAPHDAGLLIDRGKVLVKVGRDNEAIADFSHAINIDSNAAAAYRERGFVYKKLENYDAAIADLTWFARFDPKDMEVAHAIEEMQEAALPPRQEKPEPSPPQERRNEKPAERQDREISGSGFFVSNEGYVVTNAHVVKNCSNIHVTRDQDTDVYAKLVARDAANDLAVLKTTIKPERVAALRSNIRLGEIVEAFGFPLTSLLSTSGNFTFGSVTALSGIGDDSRYLQISAPVQPGNSGGPLLDQSGNLVGIVSEKLNALSVMIATKGDLPQNVNFAIKESVAASFLDSNRIAFKEGTAAEQISGPDLADQAREMSVFIECK